MTRLDRAADHLGKERLVGHVRQRFDDGQLRLAPTQPLLLELPGRVEPGVPATDDDDPGHFEPPGPSELMLIRESSCEGRGAIVQAPRPTVGLTPRRSSPSPGRRLDEGRDPARRLDHREVIGLGLPNESAGACRHGELLRCRDDVVRRSDEEVALDGLPRGSGRRSLQRIQRDRTLAGGQDVRLPG